MSTTPPDAQKNRALFQQSIYDSFCGCFTIPRLNHGCCPTTEPSLKFPRKAGVNQLLPSRVIGSLSFFVSVAGGLHGPLGDHDGVVVRH